MKKHLFLLLIFLISCQKKDLTLVYPESRMSDHVDTYFGQDVPDPYRWMEDDMAKETEDWVERQNNVTFNYLDQIPYRKKLKNRLKKLNDYEKLGAPFKEGKYEYYYKNSGLQNHSVVYRKEIGQSSSPEIFIDPNSFSDDGTVALRGISFSKDGSLAAYMITEGGSDWRKIIVIDSEKKSIIEDTLIDVKFSSVSWRGNEGFYYSSYPNPKNTSELSAKTQLHKLYYHKLGTPQTSDKLIYGGEKQPNRYISGYVTEDQNFLVISASKTTSGNQLHILDLKKQRLVTIHKEYMNRLSVVHNEGNQFFIYTNIESPNGRIFSVNLNSPKKWNDIISEKENVLSASFGGGYLFASYLVDAKTEVEQLDLNGKLIRKIKLPGIGTASGFSAKKEDKDLYYSFRSFTFPSTIYNYRMTTGESEIYQSPSIDFNAEDYITKQIFFKSKDDTSIPMFITHKKDMVMNGTNPTILYGYGGFNISLTPSFSATNLVWLENGGVYAVANLRGGGEYGKKWHLAGTKMNKQNVFDDFIAAAEYLINEKYTSSDYLATRGGSNGGLLVGATMLQRPELMKVTIPAVGVMDMLRYHQFTAGAGWSYDYGTAEDSPEMFQYLKTYSPVHAIKDGVSYPATLVTTSDHDDRVVPAHSYKFIAGLQKAHSGPNPVLIRIQTNAGHGSVSMEQRMDLASDIYAFIWYNMGVRPNL
jgi:prolyl oligopeptidase